MQTSWTELGHFDMKIHGLYGAPPHSGQKFFFSKRIERTDNVPSRSIWTPAPNNLEEIPKVERLTRTAHLEDQRLVRRNPVVEKKDNPIIIVPPVSCNENWIQRR